VRYILDRLQEKSTWVGLGALVAGLGIAIDPTLWEKISAVGLAIAGLGATLTADKPKE